MYVDTVCMYNIKWKYAIYVHMYHTEWKCATYLCMHVHSMYYTECVTKVRIIMQAYIYPCIL